MIDPVPLKSGLAMPGLGLGTWRMGEDPGAERDEIAAIRRAVERGITHIDTAEMYGEGDCEALLGRAIQGLARERLFIVSKVYPWNASAEGMAEACAASLRRLGTDYLDLYLLHWPGAIAFEQTLEGAAQLKAEGRIRAFGVSNVDASMVAALARSGLDDAVEANQVMYNPARRGIEVDLLPLMAERGIAAVAYTPLEPDRLRRNRGFVALAADLGLAPPVLALAWHLTRAQAVPIPKAGRVAHVDALVEAAGITLTAEVLEEIDRLFPAPTRPQPLDII
ncbi:MAG: aldo/keto reductase [Pseudomonadota bacterium]